MKTKRKCDNKIDQFKGPQRSNLWPTFLGRQNKKLSTKEASKNGEEKMLWTIETSLTSYYDSVLRAPSQCIYISSPPESSSSSWAGLTEKRTAIFIAPSFIAAIFFCFIVIDSCDRRQKCVTQPMCMCMYMLEDGWNKSNLQWHYLHLVKM